MITVKDLRKLLKAGTNYLKELLVKERDVFCSFMINSLIFFRLMDY